MKPATLTEAALADLVRELPEWSVTPDALLRQYRFRGFTEAMTFMTQAAVCIEALDHHPDWSNAYDRVTVRLTTHAAGNRVTGRDVELARILERIASDLLHQPPA